MQLFEMHCTAVQRKSCAGSWPSAGGSQHEAEAALEYRMAVYRKSGCAVLQCCASHALAPSRQLPAVTTKLRLHCRGVALCSFLACTAVQYSAIRVLVLSLQLPAFDTKLRLLESGTQQLCGMHCPAVQRKLRAGSQVAVVCSHH